MKYVRDSVIICLRCVSKKSDLGTACVRKASGLTGPGVGKASRVHMCVGEGGGAVRGGAGEDPLDPSGPHRTPWDTFGHSGLMDAETPGLAWLNGWVYGCTYVRT